jgi:acyl-CoA synthetase (AMP-forming)/AMP-acid ligase II
VTASEMTTIPAVLASTVRQYPDVEAVVCGPTRLTYVELAERVRTAARAFMASGVTKGDRVALWAPNSERWLVTALGVVSTGAILVPVNTRLKGAEARHILSTSQTSILVAEDGFLDLALVDMLREGGDAPTAGAPVPALPDLRELIVFGSSDLAEVTTFDTFLARAGLISEAEVEAAGASVSPDDPSDIIFTSGTTGRPKGATLLHGQTIRLYTAWSGNAGLKAGDRFLGVNPFFHCFGYKAGLLACVIKGATMVPVAVFDAVATMELIETERINIAPGTPTLYITLLDHPRRHEFDLSSLRVAVTGGSVVPTALVKRMRSDLGFGTVLNAYGLTEACGFVTSCRPDDSDEIISKTSGRPVDGVEVAIIGSQGERLGPGEHGEVLVRGYNLMAGYYRDPQSTAAVIDHDGWLHTGDVGVQDEQGNLTITDRTKDMFVVGGYNAYPAEIEQVMMHHDAVSEVAVIGVSDERMGEVGQAYVVLRQRDGASERELLDYCRSQLANYKVPRTIAIVESLPRNGSGKVDKLVLRQAAAEAAPSPEPADGPDR